MPNLSEKSSTCLTLARWPHQHRSAVTPGGKLAAFAFTGLNSWSEHGTLMVAKGEPTEQKERDRSTCAAKSVDPCFYREKSESVAGKYGGRGVAGKYGGNAKWKRDGGRGVAGKTGGRGVIQSVCGKPTGLSAYCRPTGAHYSSRPLLSSLFLSSLLSFYLPLFSSSLPSFSQKNLNLRFVLHFCTVFADLRAKTKSTVISFNHSNYILPIPPRLVALIFTRCA